MPSPADLAQAPVEQADDYDESALQSTLRSHLREAVNYRDTELAPDRRKIQAYIECDPDLDGDLPRSKNRSGYVSDETSETLRSIMPQLMDVFFSADDGIMQYVPNGPEDAENAQVATQAARYYVNRFGGMELFFPVFHDALRAHVGVVKYDWVKRKRVKEQKLEGLTAEEIEAIQLTADDDSEVEIVDQTPRTINVPQMSMGPDGMPAMVDQPLEVFDCTVRVTSTVGELELEAVPPEERLIDENAKTLQKSLFWAHARNVTVAELVELGYDEDECVELIGGDEWLTDEEAEQRENSGDRTIEDDGHGDPLMRTVPYAECFLRGDLDNTGTVGRFKICVGGAQCKIMMKPTRVPEVPAAEFQTDPVPHVATGNPFLKHALRQQALKTSLFRGMLDSLAQSIFPMRAYQENAVNAQDLLNDEPGALVRTKGPPGALVAEYGTTFAGREVLLVLQYADEREQRTGTSRSTPALDPNALQSTAKRGVDQAVDGSKQQIKAIAMILAQFGGMKALFKGVLRLLCTHVRTPQQIRLTNGKWVQFDPRDWDVDMDVEVDVARGTGSVEETIAVLDRVLAVQEKLAAGKSSLVDEQKIYNTLDRFVRLTKFRDTSVFFNPPEQPGQEPQPQGDQQTVTPEMALAKAEEIKAMAERESAIEKNMNERIRMLLEDDLERDKMETESLLKLVELAVKAGIQINVESIKSQMQAAIARERNYSELAARATAAQSQPGQPRAA